MEFPAIADSEWESKFKLIKEEVYEVTLFSGKKKPIGVKRVLKKTINAQAGKEERLLEIEIFEKVLVQIWFSDLRNTEEVCARIGLIGDDWIYGLEKELPIIEPLSGKKAFWGVRLELKIAKDRFWRARIPAISGGLVMQESS